MLKVVSKAVMTVACWDVLRVEQWADSKVGVMGATRAEVLAHLWADLKVGVMVATREIQLEHLVVKLVG